jgi:hypothetical protein
VKTDLFAALDTYATGMQIATWGWFASLAILLAAAVGLAMAIGRLLGRRIAASFTRAQQTIADIQQPREEKP